MHVVTTIAYPETPIKPLSGPEIDAYLNPAALAHQALGDLQTLALHARWEMDGKDVRGASLLRDHLQHGEMGSLKRIEALQDALLVRFWLDLGHAERMQPGHSHECHARRQHDEFNIRRTFGIRMAYRQIYPDFCWCCLGAGFFAREMERDTGIPDVTACGACVEYGVCPRCGVKQWSDDLETCRACGWTQGAPSLRDFTYPETSECKCPEGASFAGYPLPVIHGDPSVGWKRDGRW